MIEYARHPLSASFGDLPADEFAALVNDIKQNGLLTAIVTTDGNQIIDGWHRYRACLDAGVKPRFDPFTWATQSAAEQVGRTMTEVQFVVAQNMHRRHLTQEQKRSIVAELLKADPAQSDRSIAAQAKVSPTTVGTVRRELEEGVQIGHHAERTGRDGKVQPAARRASIQDQVAAAVGMSRQQLEQATEVVEAAEQDQEKFGYLVEQMDATGDIEAAHAELVKAKPPPSASVTADTNAADDIVDGASPTSPSPKKRKPSTWILTTSAAESEMAQEKLRDAADKARRVAKGIAYVRRTSVESARKALQAAIDVLNQMLEGGNA